MNKRDVECYLQSFVSTYQEKNGWTWGIQDTTGHPARWLREPAGHHATRNAALRAGLNYCWSLSKLVAIARNEARDAARYQASKKAA